jgi:cytochrome c-type biogenesis protein CcmH
MSRALVVGLLFVLAATTAAAPSAGPASEEAVREIAARLRCVVCQNLSVADSPSELANQMRGIIRERLAAGDRPDQVIAYFVDKYGEWVLLSPRPSGFNLLVWVVPFAGIAGGFIGLVILMRRWSRRSASAPQPSELDPEVRERIRREMAELEP